MNEFNEMNDTNMIKSKGFATEAAADKGVFSPSSPRYYIKEDKNLRLKKINIQLQ
jgi:hypothetical protein